MLVPPTLADGRITPLFRKKFWGHADEVISRLENLAVNHAFWSTYFEDDEGMPLLLANFGRLREIIRVGDDNDLESLKDSRRLCDISQNVRH